MNINEKIYKMCLESFAGFMGSIIHTWLEKHYVPRNEKIGMVAFLDHRNGKTYKLSYVEVNPVVSLMAREESKRQTLEKNAPNAISDKNTPIGYCAN